MNQLFEKISRALHSAQDAKTSIDLPEKTISTAAVPSPEEPKELHKGRRRVKESYTSHWDLDYLPREEAEKILRGESNRPH
ncbi:hypothetical protein [Crenothrix sp.]|uniref:hypothetical protein n=1 Tax=Crenothrix sp. TaxID=3100433 RepID=UPI00374DE195